MKPNRNYSLLLGSQFLSAFGDNVILAIIIGQLGIAQRLGKITADDARIMNAIYTSLLFIPFVFIAPFAGYLNDRFAKSRWLLGGNLIKLGGCVIASMSVLWGHYWQGIGYFIVGIGACVYSPAKYGILPEILPRERLVKANGTMELLTLIAILFGPFTGAWLIDNRPVGACYLITLGIFAGSLTLNLFMDRTPAHPEVLWRETYPEFIGNFRGLLSSARLKRMLLGTVVFWTCGAVFKMNFLPWGLKVLHLKNNTEVAQLGLVLGIGIMAGSVLAGQLHRVGDLRSTRYYGWLLAATILVLGFLSTYWLVIAVLVGTGISAGLFLIPLNAALQAESHQDKLGKTIATQNFVENIAMIFGGGYVLLAVHLQISEAAVYLGLALFVGLIACALKFAPANRAQTKEEFVEAN